MEVIREGSASQSGWLMSQRCCSGRRGRRHYASHPKSSSIPNRDKTPQYPHQTYHYDHHVATQPNALVLQEWRSVEGKKAVDTTSGTPPPGTRGPRARNDLPLRSNQYPNAHDAPPWHRATASRLPLPSQMRPTKRIRMLTRTSGIPTMKKSRMPARMIRIPTTRI